MRPLSSGAVPRGAARLVIVGLCAAMLVITGETAGASPGICRDDHSQVVSALDRVYRRGEFRIFYTGHGVHALGSTADRNGNGIPDQVKDVATQLVAARRIYSDIVGLSGPLDMPRYVQAQSIDVFLIDMKRGNGLAYDEVVNYRLAFDGPRGRCTLRIDLANNLANQNVSPAHELFHLYQYAYSMFKARWFLEGTARWAEFALRAGTGPLQPLPETEGAVRAKLLTQTYRADGVWNRLTWIVDPAGRMALPPDLAGATYLDGSAVVHDRRLHGTAFIKTLLEELDNRSARVSSRRKWNRYNWNEADQKSPEHDKDMLQAIIRAVSRYQGSKPSRANDLRAFLDAASKMAATDK